MRRAIKFRGLTEKGVFVYGYLSSENSIIVDTSDGSVGFFGEDEYYVNPDTIGQFTGLYDRKEKPIYEGDILNVCNGSINGTPWMEKPYEVKYIINKGFVLPSYCWNENGENISDSTHWCEIIGNIHQPHPLKTVKHAE